MPSKRVAFILALTATGLLLLLMWNGEPLKANANNLALAHSLCLDPTCYSNHDGELHVQSDPGPAWQHSDRLDVCQRLWLSRIQASTSPDLALSTLSDAASCPRKHLLWEWAGTLAWSRGLRKEAGVQWAQLPVNYLIEGSYALMVEGDLDRGRYILESVLHDHGLGLSQPMLTLLYAKLGDSYRLEAQWPQAATYYEQAWQLDPTNSEIRFYLGMSLREAGQAEKALPVLEGGLDGLPKDREYFVSSYSLQLGLAYQEVGRLAEAAKTFQSAKEWLEKEDSPAQTELDFIQQLIDHLEVSS
jgi:tetratricopeptide (TPR) repeat protein